MDKKLLIKTIAAGEDSKRQFKADITNSDSLAAEMVAFSNSEGGRIFIGVSDGGTLTGLAPNDVSRINQLISNTASQHVRSPISPATEIVAIGNGKAVIVLTIAEGIDKPYFDRNGVVWLKNGSDKHRINSKEELRRIFQDTDAVYADEVPTKAGISAIDRSRFNDFMVQTYNIKVPGNNRDLVRTFENLELAHKGKLNLAGLMLFAEKPQLVKPIFITKAVSFPDTSIAAKEYLDSEDFEGTLQQQYEGAVAFIMRNLRKEQRGRSVNTTGIPEIPSVVFEELLVNALIHRDYFVNGSIRVLVFSDRIEIISPGTLPNHLTVDAIKMGVSVIRNPIIVSFISKGLLPYRGLGSGIRRALEESANIDFFDDRATCSFKVTIWRTRDKAGSKGRVEAESRQSGKAESENSIQDRILARLKPGPLSKIEIAKVLGKNKPDGQVNSAIRLMVKKKQIERTIPEKPNSRLQKYRIKPNNQSNQETLNGTEMTHKDDFFQ
jgi:ATP-dependent DNA helicase RecG